jgi:hypothetical protein
VLLCLSYVLGSVNFCFGLELVLILIWMKHQMTNCSLNLLLCSVSLFNLICLHSITVCRTFSHAMIEADLVYFDYQEEWLLQMLFICYFFEWMTLVCIDWLIDWFHGLVLDASVLTEVGLELGSQAQKLMCSWVLLATNNATFCLHHL